jgi:hypothetical protein
MDGRFPGAMVPLAASSLIVWLACDASALAENRTLSWSDELCRYTIGIDPKRYDETRVRNTIHLLFGPADFKAPLVVGPVKPQDVAKLDLDRVNKECATALDLANRLAFVPLNGIEDYRRAEIAAIEDACQFETVKIRGFQNSAALREYQPAAAACTRFIDALEGKSDSMATFRQSLEENCSRNASPDQCLGRFLANAQSPNGMDWVRLYLMTFGWSNCANKFTIRSVDAKRLNQLRRGLEAEFRRTFKITKDQCEGSPE